MGKSMRSRDPAHRAGSSVNREWKERWGQWMVRGTAAAAAGHLLLILLWPHWEVKRSASDDRLEMLQIEPVLTPGALAGAEEERSITLPAVEETQGPRDGGGLAEAEVSVADLLQRYSEREIGSLVPVLASGSYARPEPPLPPRLMLDQLSIYIDPASFPMETVLPLIRNPSSLARFLKASNRIPRPAASIGGEWPLVTVAMWINAKGTVEWAEVQESSGEPRLDELALAAFNEVVLFRPAHSQLGPVPVGVSFTILFNATW
jgi:TonB family protein